MTEIKVNQDILIDQNKQLMDELDETKKRNIQLENEIKDHKETYKCLIKLIDSLSKRIPSDGPPQVYKDDIRDVNTDSGAWARKIKFAQEELRNSCAKKEHKRSNSKYC